MYASLRRSIIHLLEVSYIYIVLFRALYLGLGGARIELSSDFFGPHESQAAH